MRGLIDTSLIAFGRIDYEDIFHRKCWTTFRYHVGDTVGFSGEEMAPTAVGNDADRNCEQETSNSKVVK